MLKTDWLSMEPIAVGFMILIGTAALLGVIVGALGGIVFWRFRINLLRGSLLTALAYVLLLVVESEGRTSWMKAKLVWGAPALMLAFLLASLLAPWLASRMALRPTWTSLISLGLTWALGFVYLLLFRLSLAAPPWVALGADVFLLVLLIRNRRASDIA